MTPSAITRPMCPICGQHLTARDRGPHQQWLEREYVCLDIDCLEFGVYKAESPLGA